MYTILYIYTVDVLILYGMKVDFEMVWMWWKAIASRRSLCLQILSLMLYTRDRGESEDDIREVTSVASDDTYTLPAVEPLHEEGPLSPDPDLLPSNISEETTQKYLEVRPCWLSQVSFYYFIWSFA